MFAIARLSLFKRFSSNSNASIATSPQLRSSKISEMLDKHGREQMKKYWIMLESGIDFRALSQQQHDIDLQLKDENNWNNLDLMSSLSQRQELLMQKSREYRTIGDQLESCVDLLEMAAQENDRHLLDSTLDDLDTMESKLSDLAVKNLMQSETDSGSCFLNIHAGAGGTESCDWVSLLAGMYGGWAKRRGFKVSTVDFNKHEQAGYKFITMEISGEYACGWLRNEEGVHRLVRVSPFDANSRRHTSFASVTVSPIVSDLMLSENDISIDPNDLKIETMRAGGKGGQHVNKTESAVRITHLPTGIAIRCSQERSQHENKRLAMQMLKSRLYALRTTSADREKSEKYASLGKNEFGGTQLRSYVLFPYQLIKDGRTGVQTSQVQNVLDGDIDQFLMASLVHQASSNKIERDNN